MPALTPNAAFARLEIWSDLAARAGSRLAAIPDLLALVEDRKLQGFGWTGDSTLTFTIPVSSPAYSSLLERRVARVVYVDNTFDDWRIITVQDRHVPEGTLCDVTCADLLADLATVVVTRRDNDGTIYGDFELIGLTPQAQMQQWSGLISGYVLGFVDPTSPVDQVYSWDSALAALKRLADSTQAEYRIRQASGLNNIDLYLHANDGIPTVDVRLGKNLKGVTRLRETTNMATRVYPRGTAVQNLHPTMARAKWKVSAQAGAVITLVDPVVSTDPGPLAYDSQLNGKYYRNPAGTLFQVTSGNAATQQVTLASSPSATVGDLIEFRLNSSGDDLTFLDSPTQLSTYGAIVAVLDKPDIPGTVDLVVNPAMRIWTGASSAAPDNWTKLGAPTLTKTTTGAFTRVGGQSCRVQSVNDGDGLETQYVAVSPSVNKPYFSGFISYWMATGGQVRVELVATDGTKTYVFPDGTSAKAFSNQTNVWDDLGVAGIDFKALNITQAKIRIVQDGATACDFYVDSGQIVNEATQQAFYEGYGPTQLWQAANAQLAISDQPTVTVTIDIVDLNRLNKTAWPYDNMVLGAPINLRDEQLNATIATRVTQIKRNLLVGADTALVLSNLPGDLTDALVRPRKPARFDRPVVTPITPRVDAFFTDMSQQNVAGQLQVRLFGTPAQATVFWQILDATAAPPIIGAASWNTYGNPFQIGQDNANDRILYAYAQLGNVYSPVGQWLINKNVAASNLTMTMVESPGGTLQVSWVPDPTVAAVAVYRAKNQTGGGYPTTGSHNATDPLDTAKFVAKFSVHADVAGQDSAGNVNQGVLVWTESGYVNTDVAKVILVPLDRDGRPLARVSGSLTMTGASSTPAIASVDSVVNNVTGTSCSSGSRDQITAGCTTNAQTLNGDTIKVEYQRDSNDWVTLETVTVTGPSFHFNHQYNSDGYLHGNPSSIHNYQYRFTLARSGVPKDTQLSSILGLNQTDPVCIRA